MTKRLSKGKDNHCTYKFVCFEVGDGYNVRFWHDCWCGDSPLKLCYPVLLSIARYKDAWMVDNLSVLDGVVQWNVVFTCLAQDWEVEMVFSFYEQLYSHRIRHGADDWVVWSLSKWRHFEVKSYYKALDSQGSSSFPWKSI